LIAHRPWNVRVKGFSTSVIVAPVSHSVYAFEPMHSQFSADLEDDISEHRHSSPRNKD